MFEGAQKKGKYRCHIFDMKGSKSGYNSEKYHLLLDLLKKKVDKKHIHVSEQFPEVPFIISGDLVVLITNNGSITDKEVYKLFKEAKDESGLNKQFHYLSGNYETDDWSKGNTEYYVGYCIAELEHRSKVRKHLL